MESQINNTLINEIYRSICNHYKEKDYTMEDVISFKTMITKLESEVEGFQELLLYFLSLPKEEAKRLILRLDKELQLYMFEERKNLSLSKSRKNQKDKIATYEIITRGFEVSDIVLASSKITKKIRTMNRNIREYYKEQPEWLFEARVEARKLIHIDFNHQEQVRKRISEKIDYTFNSIKELPLGNYLERQKQLVEEDVIEKIKKIQDESNFMFNNHINRYHEGVIANVYTNRRKKRQAPAVRKLV